MKDTSWKNEAAKWRRDYGESGYLVVENAIDAATLQKLRAALERIESDYALGVLAPNLKSHVHTERDRTRHQRVGEVDNDAINSIMELPLFDELFRDIIIYPRVLDVLEALFATSEFSFHNLKCIAKMPGNQAAFQWHRDLPYLQHTSPDLLTCMICLDDMTAENGGTVVCPGSHRGAPVPALFGDTDMDENDVPHERVTVECPAGSVVVFHVNIVHGGGPNTTQSKRRNAISIWAGPDSHPITEARFAYEFVKPRSHDAMRQKQIETTFDASAFNGAA